MDPGPPLLQPFEEVDLLIEKAKCNGLSNGGQSPQMPTLFQADRDASNNSGPPDLFSPLIDDDYKHMKTNNTDKPESKNEADSFFEKMYKDYGSTLKQTNCNQINKVPLKVIETPVTSQKNQGVSKSPLKSVNAVVPEHSNDKLNLPDDQTEDKNNNQTKMESNPKRTKSTIKSKEPIRKGKKRKSNNINFEEHIEEDLKRMGIKTQIKRNQNRRSLSTEKESGTQTKVIEESKHLKSPFITPRNQSPKKSNRTVNVISSDYEIVNPALRSGGSNYNTAIYRPNLKSLYSNQFSSAYPSVCVFCGRKTEFLDIGSIYGPYAIEKDCIQGLPLTCIFPSSSGPAVGVSGKSAIKSDSNGGLKMVIQSSSSNSKPPKTSKRNVINPGADYRLTWEGEVWLHRECVLWAPATYLRGDGKIGGLEEALKMALNAECCVCHKIGAILNCTTKNCDRNFHYHCAVQNDSKLNEDQYSVLCKKHRDK